MALKHGTKNIADIKHGNNNVNYIYRGPLLIWERNPDTRNIIVYNNMEYILADNIDMTLFRTYENAWRTVNIPLKNGETLTINYISDKNLITKLLIRTAQPINELAYFCYSMNNLKELELPSNINVTKISFNFLGTCTSLTTLNIPTNWNITYIDNSFLYNCSGLQSITIMFSLPSFTETAGFMTRVPTNTIIYVKNEYLSSYKTTAPWSTRQSQYVGV